ncbi:radical SAM family heme chaperone HemW [Magnetospira sp. QH-2]|uniref:radical SAM family heme chaperone HemW n=1 Tax=Magnetospira sp. (strain QH-2) TaxID=1288970 RepID=UPI0003E81959|nr:radical SAM family heme chaperone HemW [Magnetospira sp. QH-2]CCQ75655.1 putative oxygen-independent coproporphyrinogen III oxidase (yggW) [Magnetospira sp. QH-2]
MRCEQREPRSIALYIHWPFCLAKCPYCDFNSHTVEAIDQARWRRALLDDLRASASELANRKLVSIFFGGGTPSLMDPETVAALIGQARALWTPTADLEITIEANPGTIDEGRFAAFAQAGVNRLSLGVQSFDDDALRDLGRIHDAAAARRALEMAKRLFPRVSFDLIYARPGQSPADWRAELTEALAWETEHLSLYQLTIEPGTAFAKQGRAAAGEDRAVALFDLTQHLTARAGLPAYEISNHARSGAQSRHNLVYWQGGDYLGIGPGAHGRLTIGGVTHAERRTPNPEGYLTRRVLDRVALSARERVEERLMMGLRLTEGIDRSLADFCDSEALSMLIDGGFLELDDRYLRATPAGQRRLNGLLEKLLADPSTSSG